MLLFVYVKIYQDPPLFALFVLNQLVMLTGLKIITQRGSLQTSSTGDKQLNIHSNSSIFSGYHTRTGRKWAEQPAGNFMTVSTVTAFGSTCHVSQSQYLLSVCLILAELAQLNLALRIEEATQTARSFLSQL